MDRFNKSTRVAKRFFEKFHIAHDSLVGAPQGKSEEKHADSDTVAATADGVPGVGQEAASEDKKKADVSPSDVTTFRGQCEQACAKELEGRVVMITATGTATEINATVTQTRLYQNLTDSAPVMGFYDVKNARVCNVYEGQGLTHREPAFDEEDFTRYLKSLDPLMVAGRDVLFVLTGRSTTGVPKVQKVLAAN